MKMQQNKMLSYLAVTAGVGCASSAANAAVVFYGNAGNNNIQASPTGINISAAFGGFVINPTFAGAKFKTEGSAAFTRGADLAYGGFNSAGPYFLSIFKYGAQAGAANYANISFDNVDNVFEAVAQFYLDGAGGGYLMAIATTNPIPNPQNLSAVGGPALSISAGKAMIDAAAVPEPTSLGLLALGAMGLATRRQRRKAV